MGTVTRMELRKIAELHPYEHNAKLHPPEQIEKLRRSFREFGMIVPVGIDGQDRVVYGHGRLLAAQAEGWTEVPTVTVEDLSEEQRRAFIHADNLLGETGYDKDILRAEAQALQAAGFDVTLVGFDAAGIKLETVETQLQAVTEDECDAEIPEEPKSKLGDIYQLGRHRLICGDSTDVAVIDRLMDGVKADMVLTDPPYGTTNIAFDEESKIDFWDSVEISSRKNSAKLVFSQQPYTTRLIISNEKEFKYEIIWNKTHATGFLNAKKAPLRAHETICVFYKNQPTYNPQKTIIERNDIGRKKVNGTKAEQYNDYQVGTWEWEETGERYPTDVIVFSSWNGARFGDTSNATVHPTQKPINLLSYLIKTYSNDNDIVLDLFGGSGSTLMACEQLNRKCYMCELDPHYCDVIVARWEQFTGRKAVLLNG